MNIMGVAKYHWRRRWFLSAAFVLTMVVIVLVSAGVLILNNRTVSMALDAQGRVIEHVSYDTVAFQSDPSRLINPSAFGMLVFLFALAILKRDRMFLVSVSVPRYQVLLGSFVFLTSLSVALALIGGIIAPVFCRAVLWAVGFPIRGGWNAQALFTGNNPNLMRDILISICDMIGSAGLFTLLGYIFLRWWKPLLILFGAGIAVMILLVTMVQWETYIAQLLLRAADWVQWAIEQLIPMIQNFFSGENQVAWAWTELIAGFACTALAYPVMRGMKVV